MTMNRLLGSRRLGGRRHARRLAAAAERTRRFRSPSSARSPGQYASFGAQMKNGGEMAVADINAAGGVLGKKLDLQIGDDACDPKQAVAVANQMVGQRRGARRRALLLRLLDPGLESLCRERHGADLARLDQSRLHRRPRRPEYLSRLRPRRSAGRHRRQISRQAISPTRTSPSSTTRRRTARASPTRPRRR